MDVKGKSVASLIMQIILIVFSIYFVFSGFRIRPELSFYQISLYGTIISAILWFNLIVLSGGIFSNISLIYLSFILFQFGVPILYATDKSYSNFYISLFNSSVLNSGAVFTIVCIQSFALGITLYYIKSNNHSNLIFAKTGWANNNLLVEKSSLLLFIVCLIIYFPFTLYGAFVLHSRFSMPAIVGLAKQFIFPAALLYLCYSKNKKIRFFVYFMYVFECFASMMTGGRTEGVLPLLVLIAYYFQYSGKKTRHSFIRFISLIISMIVIVVLIIIIAKLRQGSSITENEFGFRYIYESLFGELGFNFTTILFVITGTQFFGLKYGSSYLASFIALIPKSLDPFGIVNKAQLVSGASWLQQSYGNYFGFGLGFSLIGEAYYNFGVYGSIAILLLGFLIADLQSKPAKLCTNWEKYIQLALLLGILTVTRRDLYQLLKQIEYSIFIMALYIFVCSKVKRKN